METGYIQHEGNYFKRHNKGTWSQRKRDRCQAIMEELLKVQGSAITELYFYDVTILSVFISFLRSCSLWVLTIYQVALHNNVA